MLAQVAHAFAMLILKIKLTPMYADVCPNPVKFRSHLEYMYEALYDDHLTIDKFRSRVPILATRQPAGNGVSSPARCVARPSSL